MKQNKIIYLISFIAFLVIVFLSIGYSTFQSTLNINNLSAIIRLNDNIRVTGIVPTSSTGGSISNYEDYNVASLYMGALLPNADSSITYKVEVTNFGNVASGIYDINGLPDNLTYELEEYQLKQKICDSYNKCTLGIKKSFYITIKYKENGYDNSNFDYNLNLEIDFRRMNVKYIVNEVEGEKPPREQIINNDYDISVSCEPGASAYWDNELWELKSEPEIANCTVEFKGMVIDGLITYSEEYTENDIIYTDDVAKVYAKVKDGYLYLYAEHKEVDFSKIVQSRLYLGSKETVSSPYQHSVAMDTTMVYSCANNLKFGFDCSTLSATEYRGDRNEDNAGGVEYKFPMAAIQAEKLSDIINIRIRYLNYSWDTERLVDIAFREKIYPEDIEGKTVVFAKKPSGWSDINIHLFKRDGSEAFAWPGKLMGEYVDGNNDTYAYILPDDSEEYYVRFSDSQATNNMYPPDKANVFRINGKSRIWDGNTDIRWDATGEPGFNSWAYYNPADQPEYANETKFLVDGSLGNACVHIWGYSDIKSSYSNTNWPGLQMTKINDNWQLLNTEYSTFQILFTDCAGHLYYGKDSPAFRRGITIYGDKGSLWVVDD